MHLVQRTLFITVVASMVAGAASAQGLGPGAPEDAATQIELRHFRGLQWRPIGPEEAVLRLAADRAFPYRVYATREDGATLRAPHRTELLGIPPWQWSATAGADGGGVAPSPLDPEAVFGAGPGGWIERWHHQTGERRRVTLRPQAGDHRYALPMPLVFSPHDGEVLYAAGQQLFMTDEEGSGWRAISPALVATADGVVTTMAESAARPGTFWAGSNDGRVARSTDYGATWRVVTPPDLPQPTTIVGVEPAPLNQDGAYVLALASGQTHLFRTEDHGATWRPLALPGDGSVAVLRTDPRRAGLLYAGGDDGGHVSFDRGRRWLPLGLDEPVTDLLVHGNDLLAATTGRGVWVLDNIAMLRELRREVIQRPLHLCTPAPAHRLDQATGPTPQGWGRNPPPGIALDFLIGPGVNPTTVRLDLLREDGTMVRTMQGPWEESPGHHRTWWDLRHPGAPPRMPQGPRVAPGNYLVRLTAGEGSVVAQLAVLPDPRLPFPITATELQVDTLLTIRQQLEHGYSEAESPAKAALLQDLTALAENVAMGQNRPTPQALTTLQKLIEALTNQPEEKTVQ